MCTLEELDIDGKDLQIINNLYCSQKTAVRVGGELTRLIDIKKGVRQGSVFSPDSFNLYSETIMRGIEDFPGKADGVVSIQRRTMK